MTNSEHKKSREENIHLVLQQLKRIRNKIDPEILEMASQSLQPTSTSSEIKIDRKRNVRFVMDFLNSPEGAHLKDKIQS